MKKVLFFVFMFSIGLGVSAQYQINMIWCGSKEAGHSESIKLNPECMNDSPSFWSPEKGDLKCLGFKLAFLQGDESSVFTSYTGSFSDVMQSAFKSKAGASEIHFYDVIIQTPEGETMICDKVYKLRFK